MVDKHESYGYLTPEEFKTIASAPIHSHRVDDMEKVKLLADQRAGKKTRNKKPKTFFMFDGVKLK